MGPSNHTSTAILILLLLVFVLAFSFQGVHGVWEPDEGYYIGSAVSMEAQQNYLVPTLGEEIFLDPSETLLACWILIPLIVLCQASSKLGLYALPIFPAMALATVRLLPVNQPPKTSAVN